MKTYQVTLAQLAWIKGTVLIQAESYDEAFAKAKADQGDGADWPVDEDGDEVRGFGDIEIDHAYSDGEPDHEGEPPAADVLVYRAAPALAAALQRLAGAIEFTDIGHAKVIVTSDDLKSRHDAAVAAMRAAGVEV